MPPIGAAQVVGFPMSRPDRAPGTVDVNVTQQEEVEMNRTRVPVVAALATLILTLGLSGAALAAPGVQGGASFAEVRQATAKFQTPADAIAAGYVPVSACESLPGVGGMGVHYLNPALAADLRIDPLAPEVLLFAPAGDSWRLVGVEYFSVALAMTESGPAPWFGAAPPPLGFVNPAPSVLGQTFNGPMAGHNAQMPWHYDLHVWIWQGNPSGIFESWNPTVRC